MLSVVHSGALIGIESVPVEIEVNTGERGDLRFILVGLPDAAVKESLDRVCSALQNSHFQLPHTRTTINLSPGHIRKEGPIYDLPIAIGLLAASHQITVENPGDFLLAGELSLSGKILPIRGAISLAIQAKKHHHRGLILPKESAEEARIIEGIEIYAVNTLRETADFLAGKLSLKPLTKNLDFLKSDRRKFAGDFADIRGQERAKRAAEIAVAGRHNLLLIGSPGVGKSMIAKRLPSIMSQPTIEEFIEIVGIHSAAGNRFSEHTPFTRPFRSPHHTITRAGLIGGGLIPRPGEISLAHNGVLFLDELAEFQRSTLELLRQPLDDHEIALSRTGHKLIFPCNFMLVAAMNPCPCGYLGSPNHRCQCSTKKIQDYRAKISGPLLDRIDLQIRVPDISASAFAKSTAGEDSETIRRRIAAAQVLQNGRFKNLPFSHNSQIPDGRLATDCRLGESEQLLLQRALAANGLSARTRNKILKIARTIADLAGQETIKCPHLLEALQYRIIDPE